MWFFFSSAGWWGLRFLSTLFFFPQLIQKDRETFINIEKESVLLYQRETSFLSRHSPGDALSLRTIFFFVWPCVSSFFLNHFNKLFDFKVDFSSEEKNLEKKRKVPETLVMRMIALLLSCVSSFSLWSCHFLLSFKKTHTKKKERRKRYQHAFCAPVGTSRKAPARSSSSYNNNNRNFLFFSVTSEFEAFTRTKQSNQKKKKKSASVVDLLNRRIFLNVSCRWSCVSLSRSTCLSAKKEENKNEKGKKNTLSFLKWWIFFLSFVLVNRKIQFNNSNEFCFFLSESIGKSPAHTDTHLSKIPFFL